MTRSTHFIEPLDVLVLRGNKLFGAAGSFGESLVPPSPSVAAGAYRSALLAHKQVDLGAYARGEIDDTELGTPRRPGRFTASAFRLARRDGEGRVEALHPVPADLVVSKIDEALTVRPLKPTTLNPAIASAYPLPLLPVLSEPERGKPAAGLWLSEAGWRAYRKGRAPVSDHLVANGDLWALDPRVGVGLEADRRRAADGKLFTVQAVVLRRREQGSVSGTDRTFDVGFLAQIDGATLPGRLLLRLGGDGRAALSAHAAVEEQEPDYGAIAHAGRCRFVLTSPGIFAQGWLPTGIEHSGEGEPRLDLHGVKGRLVSAVVPRAEVVSGFDLAAWSQGKGGPKPARRVAPAGSVYWLDELEATAEDLRKLVERGLWTDAQYDTDTRRAEGFNRVALATWS